MWMDEKLHVYYQPYVGASIKKKVNGVWHTQSLGYQQAIRVFSGFVLKVLNYSFTFHFYSMGKLTASDKAARDVVAGWISSGGSSIKPKKKKAKSTLASAEALCISVAKDFDLDLVEDDYDEDEDDYMY